MSILASAGAALLAILASTALLVVWSGRRPPIDSSALPSLVVPAYTTHARLLPVPSKHAFSYPLLYFGVDLDSLESKKLDLPLRLLSYGGSPWTKVLGVRTDAYLGAGSTSLRRKLESLLVDHGIKKEDIGRVWLVTMPSYLGFEGINPLSVWYVYGDGDKSGLIAVVLEVHNTFGEKHAYVLTKTSSTKHAQPTPQYDHTWTFPRSFHVSPFNSRNGFYQLDIVDPFLLGRLSTHVPEIRVFLRLLTPEGTPKLQALLASSPTRQPFPISPENTGRIAATVFFRYPVTLLSTLPRILYQAYLLHYDKKLSVYPRPEPKVLRPAPTDHQQGALFNEPQTDDAHASVSVGWQSTSWVERRARRLVEAYVHDLPRSCGVIQINFSSGQPSIVRSGALVRLPVLRIDTEDPKFFSNLLSTVTTDDWLALASERGTTVSHPGMFERYFAIPHDKPPSEALIGRWIRHTRLRYRRFFWSHSTVPPTPALRLSAREIVIPAMTLRERLLILVIAYWTYTLDTFECAIMGAIGARFVDNQAPWQVWERALSQKPPANAVEIGGDLSESPGKRRDSTGSWIDLGSTRYTS